METGAISSLLSKLGELLKAEYDLQTGVKGKLKSLQEELECAHAALIEVAEVPPDHKLDPQVRIWAREVREASYDMEDILDTFLVRVEGLDDPANKDAGWIKRLSKPMTKLLKKIKERHKIAGAIEDIHKRLKEVTGRRDMYKVKVDKLAAPSTVDPRLEAMHKEVAQLVGIEDSSAELKSMLLSSQLDDASNAKMKVVSVVGPGGLGKTTLAKAVFDKLKSEYECKAFVSVGRNTDLMRVFKDILFDLDKTKYRDIHSTGRGLSLLIRELEEFLKDNKRYFIVIDDVWDLESWRNIKLALVENNCGSRIITTTRNSKVAIEAGEVYRLQPLSHDNSKMLFCARVFGVNSNQLDEVPNEILHKCAGVPLAIITMASLLADKPKDQWIEVCKSIGFRDKDNKQVDDTMRILSYSYDDMPPHLRTCLLYLSVYPEDYRIEKNVLIWKWIAEGFVIEKPGIELSELGERYFNDLVNRSMIQPIESNWDGSIEGCCVHDMVLDLTRDLSYKENFVTLLDDDNGGRTSSSQCMVLRRLAHQNKTAEQITTHVNAMEMQKVRSYIVCRCEISRWALLENFKLLRVLAIENCKYMKGQHLGSLGHLLHLRYLGLRGTDIDLLPEQIGNLKFLQLLDLTRTGIHELPLSVFQLTRLMCLRTDYPWMIVPDGFAKLTSLEELQIQSGYEYVSRILKGLGSLRELRVLKSTSLKMLRSGLERDLVESLRNLHKIQHLSLFIEGITNADISIWEAQGFVLPQHLRHLSLGGNMKFPRLPSCINLSCLPYLTHLSLWVADMDEQVLRLMGALPELRYLGLSTDSTLTLIINVSDCGDRFFQKLRFFRIQWGMIQFQLNEDGSSVSFYIWCKNGAMPFGCRRNDRRPPPFAVMPNLEVLDVAVYVKELMDADLWEYYSGNIGLKYLPLLREAQVGIYREDVSGAKEAEDAILEEIKVHPNRPRHKISRF